MTDIPLATDTTYKATKISGTTDVIKDEPGDTLPRGVGGHMCGAQDGLIMIPSNALSARTELLVSRHSCMPRFGGRAPRIPNNKQGKNADQHGRG